MEHNLPELVDIRSPLVGQSLMARAKPKEIHAKIQPISGRLRLVPTPLRLPLFHGPDRRGTAIYSAGFEPGSSRLSKNHRLTVQSAVRKMSVYFDVLGDSEAVHAGETGSEAEQRFGRYGGASAGHCWNCCR